MLPEESDLNNKLQEVLNKCILENTHLKAEKELLAESLKIAEKKVEDLDEDIRVSNRRIDRLKIELSKNSSSSSSNSSADSSSKEEKTLEIKKEEAVRKLSRISSNHLCSV